jgi:hypothetical protein
MASVDEVVPVRNDVAERTAVVTKGDAAIHAASALKLELIVREFFVELAIVLQPFFDGPLRG